MKKPFHNVTAKPIYKGPTLIEPGESRDVDEIYLDDESVASKKSVKLSNIEVIQKLTIKQACAEFGTLTDDELDDLAQLESEQENPRSTLLDKITVEKLERAGDDSDTDTDTDSDSDSDSDTDTDTDSDTDTDTDSDASEGDIEIDDIDDADEGDEANTQD